MTATTWVPFWAALGSAVIAGPVMWWLNRFRRENSQQHGEGVSTITTMIMGLANDIRELRHRFDRHVADEEQILRRIGELENDSDQGV